MILPFSYQSVDHAMIGKQYVYSFLNSNEIKQIEEANNEPSICPVWGLKWDLCLSKWMDVEMYYYQYHPVTRELLYSSKDPTMTMYSKDVFLEDYINYYYISYTTDQEDKGYSLKKNQLQNDYYRYHSNAVLKFQEYIVSSYLTYYEGIKTTFIADKHIRHMIGVYYDGINSHQYNQFIYDFQLPFPSILKDEYCSIHIDYDKETKQPIRIGIYGLWI